MSKEMFINAQREEVRIAIVTDAALAELYTERASAASQVGNIYKGRVTNVEPSIQAAFVDFGKAKNGFLHISDLHPRYFPRGQQQAEEVGRKRARRDRPPVQACLQRGREVIVQVTKEGIGTKGATLTTYLSIPGRYLVLMPGMQRLGVSRKIEDEKMRSSMRELLEELKPPPEMGFILRTAGLDQPKRELQRDLNYLLRLWRAVEQRSREARAPAELYQESDVVIRTIRDVYTTEIQRIVCDDETVACQVKEFLKLTMPRSRNRVEYYSGRIGLFDAFGLEREMESINSPIVSLPSGGSMVIDQTEALVAIDVNSGRLRDTDTAEQTALRTNIEAAREVARQLRLRDLGGVIVIDFIDMIEERHRRRVENLLRDEFKHDRARTKLLRMSRFGIVEMTRQRVRPSLVSSMFRPCAHCGGTGRVKSEESQALAAMRMVRLAANDESIAQIEMAVHPAVAEHILNRRRAELSALEGASNTRIRIHGEPALPMSESKVRCTDARGLDIQWDASALPAARPADVPTREVTNADAAACRKRLREAAQAKAAEAAAAKPPEAARPSPPEAAQPQPPQAKPPGEEKPPGRRPSRRRRRSKAKGPQPGQKQERPPEPAPQAAEAQPAQPEQQQPEQKPKGRSRRRRRRKKPGAQQPAPAQPAAPPGEGGQASPPSTQPQET